MQPLIMRHIKLGLAFIVTIFCVTVWLSIGTYAKYRSETLRYLAAQRLNLPVDSSLQEIETFFNCDYLQSGINLNELIERLQKIDDFLLSPPAMKVSFQGDLPQISLSEGSRYHFLTVRFVTLDNFNRQYTLDERGNLLWWEYISSGLDGRSEQIRCLED